MPKQKVDGVVESVRYTTTGEIEWVRAFERSGAIFGDHVLLSRDDLISRLKAGKRFVVGKRIIYQGATFETARPIQLAKQNGSEIILTSDSQASNDHLEGAPII